MDYKFQVDGVFCPPSDMQRYTLMRLREQRTIGNWCGTGGERPIPHCSLPDNLSVT